MDTTVENEDSAELLTEDQLKYMSRNIKTLLPEWDSQKATEDDIK